MARLEKLTTRVITSMSTSEYTIRNCVLGFKCNASWGEMRVVRHGDKDAGVSGARFCSTCQKEVFGCADDGELIENIRLNRCVSFINEGVPLPTAPEDILRVITLRE